MSTGALATAGGVVFAGSIDRFMRAFDDASGKVLWEARLNDVPNAPPISFSVNGKQISRGNRRKRGRAGDNASQCLVPELQNPPDRSATLWVFELP